MAITCAQLARVVLLTSLVWGSHGARVRNINVVETVSQPVNQTGRHPVHILLTRHGVSCANIVNHFISGYKNWILKKRAHTSMKDPLLCSAGEYFTEQAGREVPAGLERLGIPKPDAVLASVLGRAVHTAVLEYPDTAPVYVVPYIKEIGWGEDNKNHERRRQVENLEAVLGQVERSVSFDNRSVEYLEAMLGRRAWGVNYQYPEELGYDHGADWDKFIDFLRTRFIPDFLRTSEKPAGEPIVLAVVSHSNFMNKDPVRKWCKPVYKESKAKNNQVVHLEYKFIDSVPIGHGHYAEPWLVRTETACSTVVEGMSVRKSETSREIVDLCKKDVGATCLNQIKTEGFNTLPDFLDDKVEETRQKIEKLKESMAKDKAPMIGSDTEIMEKLERFKMELETLEKKLETLEKTPCWSGGHVTEVAGDSK